MGMMLRYLRIAVTALSLVACVLLGALWVRSYQRLDRLGWMTIGPWAIQVESVIGKVIMLRAELGNELFVDGRRWELDSDNDVGGAKQMLISGPLEFSYIEDDHGNTQIVGPHWFLFLVSASIAAMPWMHLFKRFSLGTLIIATTLVAVGLVVIVVTM